MATSTFMKQFSVDRKKAAEFVDEMSKTATPTLPRDFKANLAHLSRDTELRNSVQAALKKQNDIWI